MACHAFREPVSMDAYRLDLPGPDGKTFGRLGIEIGSLTSFFSAESPGLGRLAPGSDATLSDDTSGAWRYDAVALLPEASVRVAEVGARGRSGGTRSINVEATRSTLLMDAVLRFTFPALRVRSARIGDECIEHLARNRYHQRPIAPVSLELEGGERLVFSPRSYGLPPGMEPVVYLRDERGRWVLHVRALAVRPEATVLKGCHRWFNGPFPDVVQRLARRSHALSRHLLYVRERVSQRIPIQVNGAVGLAERASIQLAVDWQWH
jgi:hypothetical protein